MNTLQEVAAILKEKDNYLIMGHIDADGDCIGSMFALKWVLDILGKKSTVLVEQSPQEDFAFLSLQEVDYQLISDVTAVEEDYHVIALDSGDLDRLGAGEELVRTNFLINLDHHIDNPGYGDINYINAEMAATGEIIYELALLLGVELNKKIGTAIAVALISDTGSFKYENTSAHIFKIMADLVGLGVDNYQLNRALYANNSFSGVKLKGLALATLTLENEGKVAWLYVDSEMMDSSGADSKATTGLVNYARDIKGVEVGIAFTYEGEQKSKVSFRSNRYVSVNEIATKFGGGGHARAAGCTVNKDIKQTIKQVLDEVKRFV